MPGKTAADFKEYAAAFSPKVRTLLRKMRQTIRAAAPAAKETISYGIPTFTLDGKKLVWFAAFKGHIGFYPGAAAIAAFTRELSAFQTAKGSVRLPFDEPLPAGLIAAIVRFRVAQVGSG
jgi:uncharacterized protein YdhG (YjbR/CyaY superfamily)